MWLPVKKVKNTQKKSFVYNIEVDSDNSYTANNVVVHNCQAWSVAGKQGGDTDPRGQLVHTLIAIWNQIKDQNPNVKFLFENVKMKKEFIEYINNLFGVEPIHINSALVSAQTRKRLYWTNIEGITQPEDKGIMLKDIVHEFCYVDRDKSH